MKNEQLYYDDNCPLCRWYSGKFVDAGMLTEGGRCKFESIDSLIEEGKVDGQRARNFIPLHIPEENKTLYGVDSLLHLIGKRLPILSTIGRWKPIYFMAGKLYKFVSYNRRVIIPSHNEVQNDAAEPDFNISYRLLFVGFAVFFSTIITRWTLDLSFLVEFRDVGFMAIASGWALSFLIVILLNSKQRAVDLLGQYSAIMVRGVLIFGLVKINYLVALYLSTDVGEFMAEYIGKNFAGGLLMLAYAMLFFSPFLILLSFLDMNIKLKSRLKKQDDFKWYLVWLFSMIIAPACILIFQYGIPWKL